jgi:hypothetical protein
MRLGGGDRSQRDPPQPTGAEQVAPRTANARPGSFNYLPGPRTLLPVSTAREAFVHQAELLLREGTDPAAPGAAVTVALCGHWEHEGPCRWPHHNAIDSDRVPARFRTLFVADAVEEQAIRELIVHALTGAAGWSLATTGARAVEASERDLARRLVRGPSAQPGSGVSPA